MAIPFTQLGLSKLLGREGERLSVRDAKVKGLRAELRPSGTLTFCVLKRLPGSGPLVRVTIGIFPVVSVEAARTKAAEVLAEIAKGQNVAEIRRTRRGEPTLADLKDHWLEHAKQHKRSWKGDEGQYRLYLSPWGKRRLSSITKAEVKGLHARLGEQNGKYTANRVLALISSMFAYSNSSDFCTVGNPAHGIDKFREQSRDRFLQPDEMPRFFEALNAEPNQTLRDFIRLALLTGARRANLQAMAWRDVNLDTATWRIPETKSGDPVILHLSTAALEVLQARQKATAGNPWVFPTNSASGHLEEPKTAWRRILKRAGIENLRIHDLRRTLGSWQAASGASLSVIGKSLGHKNQATTAIYARLNIDPVRASVDLATAAMLKAAQPAGELGDRE